MVMQIPEDLDDEKGSRCESIKTLDTYLMLNSTDEVRTRQLSCIDEVDDKVENDSFLAGQIKKKEEDKYANSSITRMSKTLKASTTEPKSAKELKKERK